MRARDVVVAGRLLKRFVATSWSLRARSECCYDAHGADAGAARARPDEEPAAGTPPAGPTAPPRG
jgi:hypothetical protein